MRSRTRQGKEETSAGLSEIVNACRAAFSSPVLPDACCGPQHGSRCISDVLLRTPGRHWRPWGDCGRGLWGRQARGAESHLQGYHSEAAAPANGGIAADGSSCMPTGRAATLLNGCCACVCTCGSQDARGRQQLELGCRRRVRCSGGLVLACIAWMAAGATQPPAPAAAARDAALACACCSWRGTLNHPPAALEACCFQQLAREGR